MALRMSAVILSSIILSEATPPNGSRLSCSALKEDSFLNLRAATFKRLLGRWRERISGLIRLQLVKEHGQRIAGRAIAPHNFKRRPDGSRVAECSNEHVRDICPGDPVMN